MKRLKRLLSGSCEAVRLACNQVTVCLTMKTLCFALPWGIFTAAFEGFLFWLSFSWIQFQSWEISACWTVWFHKWNPDTIFPIHFWQMFIISCFVHDPSSGLSPVGYLGSLVWCGMKPVDLNCVCYNTCSLWMSSVVLEAFHNTLFWMYLFGNLICICCNWCIMGWTVICRLAQYDKLY